MAQRHRRAPVVVCPKASKAGNRTPGGATTLIHYELTNVCSHCLRTIMLCLLFFVWALFRFEMGRLEFVFAQIVQSTPTRLCLLLFCALIIESYGHIELSICVLYLNIKLLRVSDFIIYKYSISFCLYHQLPLSGSSVKICHAVLKISYNKQISIVYTFI